MPTTERQIQVQNKESPVEKIAIILPEKKKEIKYKTFIEEAALFVCFSSLLIASFTSETLRESTIWEVEGWRWSILLYALLAGWILVRWAVRLVGVPVKFLQDREWIKTETASLILGLSPIGTVFIWVVLVLVGWLLLIIFRIGGSKDGTGRAFSFVAWAIVGVLVGFVIWMVRNLFLQFIVLDVIIGVFKGRVFPPNSNSD